MKSNRGSPAYQCTIDQFQEIIKPVADKADMIYDFEEFDCQDEKDALWGGY